MKTNKEAACPFLSPISYVIDGERKRFEAYQEELAKETDLTNVWRWYDRDFFPFDLEVYIDIVEKFLPEKIEIFASHCDMLKAPVFLKEIFDYAQNVYTEDFLFEFLEKAPISSSKNNNGEDVWNKTAFAAPIMIDFIFDVLLHENPINKDINEEKIAGYALKTGDILSKRADGCFLVLNYVKYLLTSMKDKKVTYVFIENISKVFNTIFNQYYNGTDRLKILRPKGFTLKDNREKFSQTGLLGVTGKSSMYIEMLTQMQFYDKDKLGDYIHCFEDSILLEDDMFKAFSARPLLCHYYIADIYLATENPIEAWKSTWGKLSPARHRVFFNRYDEFSCAIERNINFFIIVGIAMMEELYQDDSEGDFTKGKNLCNILLDIFNDLMNKLGKNSSTVNHEMFKYIVTWKYMFDKTEKGEEEASHIMMEYILSIDRHPRQILELVASLLSNGFLTKLKNDDKKVNSFHNKIKGAAGYAISQEKCERKFAALGKSVLSKFI